MSKVPAWLLQYRRDVYSQTGEDGIIERILETLPTNDRWCVEFGAWDGMFLTNTRNLIEKGYASVLIEADRERFSKLQRNYKNRKNVIAINEYVGFTPKDNLDQVLSNTPVPKEFDFLSIDIDGNDYHVWRATSAYRPKVVVIEFNPTIPTHVYFVQLADASISQGTSLLAMVELGREKGYELVSVLPHNAFFVKREYYDRFEIVCNAPEVLRTNLDALTYLFSGYDGTIFLHGGCRLPWHAIELRASRVQHLPRFLRRYPSNYTLLQKIAFGVYLLVTDPPRLLLEVRKRLSRASGSPLKPSE